MMQLLSPVIFAALIVSCLALLCQGAPLQEVLAVSWARRLSSDESLEMRSRLVKYGDNDKKSASEETKKRSIEGLNDGEEDIFEDQDFEDDDDDDDLITLTDSETHRIFPLTHLHQKRGEILVPCFGMWWPVGGGYLPPPPVYDYGGDDYYGDYRRKRRRSKKQKKARTKKKKS